MRIYQKIQKAVNKYFNKGDLVTCSQIVSVTRKEYPEVKKSCILPSDYCDNHKNKDPWSGRYKIFHKRHNLGDGKYEIL